jgi:hypothetical protein
MSTATVDTSQLREREAKMHLLPSPTPVFEIREEFNPSRNHEPSIWVITMAPAEELEGAPYVTLIQSEPPTDATAALQSSSGTTVADDWQRPCEALFRSLARSAPRRLLSIIGSGQLTPPDLTFAAEALGDVQDSNLVVPVLLQLLDHASSLVREGAVYGLSHHLNDESMKRLQVLADEDPSPGVRSAANDILAWSCGASS